MRRLTPSPAEPARAARPSCTTRGLRHPCSAWHLWLVREYHTARAAWEAAADNTVGRFGAGTREWADYTSAHPAPTFRAWLHATRGASTGEPAGGGPW